MQALEEAEMLLGAADGSKVLAQIAATLLLRPTETTLIGVEYKQLTEEIRHDA